MAPESGRNSLNFKNGPYTVRKKDHSYNKIDCNLGPKKLATTKKLTDDRITSDLVREKQSPDA